MIQKVVKRDGRVVDFDKEHIRTAISKAFIALKEETPKIFIDADIITENVCCRLDKDMMKVEEIQNIVEEELMKTEPKIAKAYILHRQKRTEIRKAKVMIGIEDDLKLPLNSLLVLASRYLLKDEAGKIIETPKQMFIRVAKFIAEADLKFGKTAEQVEDLKNSFYELMSSLTFLPNSPTLMNAGTNLGQLSACFVIPIADDIMSIMKAVTMTAIIHKSGGGTGFSFSRIRPMGDVVQSTGGIASGALSFMRIFDVVTDVIKQGGKRRGANMGILRCDHPEIEGFITMKNTEGYMSNFNISVAITDKFMEAVKNNKLWHLINPRTGKAVYALPAISLWNQIVYQAYRNGEPAIVFIDRINEFNPVSDEFIEATNPCGEQPLSACESCNLGSINLTKFVRNGDIDWDRLVKAVHLAIHFLDNVIEMNSYPFKEIEDATLRNRKVGLGIMGFADLLIHLKIPYNSNDAVALAERIIKFIQVEARKESERLGLERGSFPNFEKSIFKTKYKAMRNATVTTIAPTGTISEIAGCSSGIEPLFAITYVRNVEETLGYDLKTINEQFENECIKNGIYSDSIIESVSGKSSIQDVLTIPVDIKKIFVTAHDIQPEWHVKIQAAFQKYTDNAVSKTINFPNKATPDDVENAFKLAYDLGCKGITVYRDASRQHQVICPSCTINT